MITFFEERHRAFFIETLYFPSSIFRLSMYALKAAPKRSIISRKAVQQRAANRKTMEEINWSFAIMSAPKNHKPPMIVEKPIGSL